MELNNKEYENFKKLEKFLPVLEKVFDNAMDDESAKYLNLLIQTLGYDITVLPSFSEGNHNDFARIIIKNSESEIVVSDDSYDYEEDDSNDNEYAPYMGRIKAYDLMEEV